MALSRPLSSTGNGTTQISRTDRQVENNLIQGPVSQLDRPVITYLGKIFKYSRSLFAKCKNHIRNLLCCCHSPPHSSQKQYNTVRHPQDIRRPQTHTPPHTHAPAPHALPHTNTKHTLSAHTHTHTQTFPQTFRASNALAVNQSYNTEYRRAWKQTSIIILLNSFPTADCYAH